MMAERFPRVKRKPYQGLWMPITLALPACVTDLFDRQLAPRFLRHFPNWSRIPADVEFMRIASEKIPALDSLSLMQPEPRLRLVHIDTLTMRRFNDEPGWCSSDAEERA
jgi:hypothetical protein